MLEKDILIFLTSTNYCDKYYHMWSNWKTPTLERQVGDPDFGRGNKFFTIF